jgi:hypothetical protein
MYQTLILDAYCRASFDSFCEIRGVNIEITKKRSKFLSRYLMPDASNMLLPNHRI